MGNLSQSPFKRPFNLLLISISIVQLNLFTLLIVDHLSTVHSFILPAVDNTSTIHNLTKINEKQLSFSELYPNLASLHQLLTSSIEYSSGHQYGVQPATPTESHTDDTSATTAQVSADQQSTDDLMSKDKSIINIKFIKKLPRKLDIKKERRKLDYLKLDTNLNFDSPYLIEEWNNCTVKFKSFVRSKDTGELWIHNNYELQKQNYSKQIHVKIEGLNCVQLPIKQLRPYSNNITSLVVSRTGVERLGKYVFGSGSLIKLETLYLHENTELVQLKSRTFDGLPFLAYLSIINNDRLDQLDADTFAGVKNLEELIYIGNGQKSWSYEYFSQMIKVVSSRILPNLIHFHLSASKCLNVDEDEHEFKLMKRYYNELFLDANSSSSIDRTKGNENKKPTNSGIKINRNDLIYIDQVRYLQLEDCEIIYLSSDAFEPLTKNLVQLNLAYNPLISPSNLKQVLKQFFVTNLNQSPSNHFNKKRYSKSYQFQSKDDPDTYSNMSNSSYSITSASLVNSNYIQTNTNNNSILGLEALDLSGVLTSLHTIPKDLLTVISKTTIKQLYLKNVFWRGLAIGDLPPMPNLHTLHIDYSFLDTIDENVFNTCENLVSLSLKGNLLSTIPLNMLEPLTKLERLDLSGYKSNEQDEVFYRKFTFCKKTFVYGTNLKDLNLNYKNLDLLERKIFIGLFKLENLYLKHTNLKYVEYLTFFSLKSIVKIDLSSNPLLIYNIRLSEEDTFVGLEAIEEVNLSNCNITDQDINDQNSFKRMKENLKVLDLSNNQISRIEAQTFADFNELRSIDLSHNQIRSWQMKIFAKNNFITSLDVSYNRLKEISPEMLADFRRLKRLGFSNNPLTCDCKWKGSILWLNNDNKQKKILNKLNNHEIQEHLESLVNRQQQIVTTVYASTDLSPPKSIIDWLEYSNIEFIDEQHPLRSQSYYCHIKDNSDSSLNETTLDDNLNSSVSIGTFVNNYCLNSLFINGSFKFTMLIVIVSSMMLLTTFCLMIALVYDSPLRNSIAMVENDFLHHFEYDAFVSYNFNDSDWVLNKLVPSLEDLPDSNNSQSSKIHFSSIYQDNEQYNLRTWIRSNKNKRSLQKMNEKTENNRDSKDSYCRQTNCTQTCDQTHGPNQQNRIKLCVYERDFIAGKQISDCITESIRNSRKVILVISKNFAQSAWCRFETDLAHHELVNQNRDGLILIKLEELSSEFLEKTAPQLHFLLKTRIYLNWSEDKKEQQVFWKKLHSALGFHKTNNNTYNHIRNMYQNYCTNYKPDLKRRHSVVLAPTQNELNSYEKNKVEEKLAENFVSDSMNDRGEKFVDGIAKDENIFKERIMENAKMQTSSSESKEDQVDNRLKGNEKMDNEICRTLIRKLNENERIKLRNFNQILLNNSYDNLPFYRLLFTTQNLLPDLYDKLVMMKRLVINLMFSGFPFRS